MSSLISREHRKSRDKPFFTSRYDVLLSSLKAPPWR